MPNLIFPDLRARTVTVRIENSELRFSSVTSPSCPGIFARSISSQGITRFSSIGR
ncbi:hypothetical protein [Desulfobacula sp.]|uniref:hypothetical protein n=1 Tax=Desulfobacula sp. TaxID=2593537 RepID=UPI002632064C|nr:hypothetical protein [Desulfobacula sp.]